MAVTFLYIIFANISCSFYFEHTQNYVTVFILKYVYNMYSIFGCKLCLNYFALTHI